MKQTLTTTASYGEEVEFDIKPCEVSRHINRAGEIVELTERGYKVTRVSIDGKDVRDIDGGIYCDSDVKYWMLSEIEKETGCAAVEINL